MFDFFQIIHFNNKKIDTNYSFFKNEYYKNIIGKEVCKKLSRSYFCFLEKSSNDLNYYNSGNIYFFIFGVVYTNNYYKSKTGLPSKKLTVTDIYALYSEYNEDIVNYLKGSFVLLIYNESLNSIKIITDRLNVLPLYYSIKNNCLVISSSIRMIMNTNIPGKKINHQALTEQLIFDYIIGEKTFYENIFQVGPGKIYNFNANSISSSQYWDVENLYHENLFPQKESLEILSNQLHENVELYTSDRDKILLSLTGGFDGRTNLAMLNRHKKDFLCYSYGMPGSQQIEIPKLIAQELNIQYQPVYLDESYEKNYFENALQAIEFSNGTAPIMRANYPYAYKKLQKFSNVILTGLFGSEILRPIYNLGIQFNNHSERLFLSQEVEKSILESIKEIKEKNYINPEILDNSTNAIIKDFKLHYFEKYKNYDYLTRFFFFIIKEGLRKYFMQEIQIERLFVSTRFPYFDNDLLELIYQTPFAGMYNGFLGKSKAKRKKGQLLYAYIINKYNPALGNIKVDRGYTPDDLLKPFPLNYTNIGIGVWKQRRYLKRKGNDTFNSIKWTEPFIKSVLNYISENNDYLEKGLFENFKNKKYKNDLLSYSHLISLSLFNNNYYKFK